MQNSMHNIVHYQYSITVENLTLEILIEKNLSPEYSPITNLANHTHPFLEIFICQKNCLALNTPEGIMYLREGEAAIIPPFIPHHCLMDFDTATWYAMSFSLQKQAVQNCHDMYSLVEPYITSKKIIRFSATPELITIIQNIYKSYSSNRRLISSLHFIHYLCKLAEDSCLVELTEQADATTLDSDLVRLNRLDRIINTEFMQDLTAEKIASKLNISSRHLARIAKKRYNKTLHQVITEKRITTAANMLKTTTFSIERIAAMVGYSSKVGFWREFQKMYKMTPMEYRKS